MAKSIFGITASSGFLRRETILQVGQRVVQLFQNLAGVDRIFENVIFIGKDDDDGYPLDLHSADVAKQLAQLILKLERRNSQGS